MSAHRPAGLDGVSWAPVGTQRSWTVTRSGDSGTRRALFSQDVWWSGASDLQAELHRDSRTGVDDNTCTHVCRGHNTGRAGQRLPTAVATYILERRPGLAWHALQYQRII